MNTVEEEGWGDAAASKDEVDHYKHTASTARDGGDHPSFAHRFRSGELMCRSGRHGKNAVMPRTESMDSADMTQQPHQPYDEMAHDDPESDSSEKSVASSEGQVSLSADSGRVGWFP